MRTVLILIVSVLATVTEAHAQLATSLQPPTASLELKEPGQSHAIGIQVTVNDLTYNEYWTSTFDAIFAFADSNSDGTLDAEEIRLVPSARAVRLSLGSGFTPPVKAIESLKEIVVNESQKCSKEELRCYYRRNGAGRLQIGYGKLPHTAAITAALVLAFDKNQDGKVSQTELQSAELTLRRFDTNDDELIGVGELVLNGTYPGSWAANALQVASKVDLSPTGDSSLVLKRLLTPSDDRAIKQSLWQIALSDQLTDQPLNVSTKTLCEGWSVPGPLFELHDQLIEEITNAEVEPSKKSTNESSRNRRSSRAWLTPLADRNRDGVLTQQEIDQWLKLQKQLIHGQLLISVYYGGGLFELLDTNHDAGLSIRELRGMWKTLQSASCTSASHVELNRVPHVVLLVISRGYPNHLAKTSKSVVEWFILMDRNADGDVSRREFSGSPKAFDQLDQDHDGLLSHREVKKFK